MVSWGLSKSWFLMIQKWLQGFWWSKVFDDPEILRLVGLSMSWCPNGILLLKRAPISLGPNSRAIHVWNILKLACRSKQHIMLFYTFKVLDWNLNGQVIGSAVARRASFRTASHFPTRLGGPTCFSFLQPFWRCLSPSGDSGMHYDWGNNADRNDQTAAATKVLTTAQASKCYNLVQKSSLQKLPHPFFIIHQTNS